MGFVSTYNLRQACPTFFCCAGNFGKILSVCGQHEVKYVMSGMYKYTYNWIYFCVFFYILYMIKITDNNMKNL